MTRELRITRYSNGEVVKRVSVDGRSDREVERIEAGILINMSGDFIIVDTLDTKTATDWEETWKEHLHEMNGDGFYADVRSDAM